MKTKLISILNSYDKNRCHNDFNLLLTINNYLMLDETVITKIDNIDEPDALIRVSLMNGYDRLGVVFHSDGYLGISLPLSGLFLIKGDDVNMSYDEIKSLLLEDTVK